MPGVAFTPDAAKRIVKAVKTVEQSPVRFGGRNGPTAGADVWFHARLTAIFARDFSEDGSPDTVSEWDSSIVGQRPFYSWVKLGAENGQLRPVVPAFTGTASAQPLNADPIAHKAVGRIVRLQFTGYSKDGTPLYVFTEDEPRDPDNTIPVHDHRDNHHGGFAFAVYHPGTQLPQQPWAI